MKLDPPQLAVIAEWENKVAELDATISDLNRTREQQPEDWTPADRELLDSTVALRDATTVMVGVFRRNRIAGRN
jgi:hypothetical protein